MLFGHWLPRASVQALGLMKVNIPEKYTDVINFFGDPVKASGGPISFCFVVFRINVMRFYFFGGRCRERRWVDHQGLQRGRGGVSNSVCH